MTRDDVMRETVKHVRRVGNLVLDVTHDLQRRAMCHDDSKFSEDEFPAFAEATPLLRLTSYGSEEYKENLKRIGPAVDLHQKRNRHHPEFHPKGIHGMNLLDFIEMLADWKAASERHADGDLRMSIIHNQKRFGYRDEIMWMLLFTAIDLGWIDGNVASKHEEINR